MAITIPILERSRKFGYIYWKADQDEGVKKFLGDADKIKLWVWDSFIGNRRIDWKNRRISIGYSRTREIGHGISAFQLIQRKDGSIKVTWE